MDEHIKKIKTLFRTGFFHIFGGSVINKIIVFLSSVVLIHILTKREYGFFTYTWNIYSIIMIANGMGVEFGILQLTSEKGGNKEFTETVCSYGARFGLKIDALIGVLLLCIGLFVPLKFEQAQVLMCMLFALPSLQLLYQISTMRLRAQKRNQEYARLTIVNTLLVFAMSALGAHFLRERGLVIGYYIAFLLSLAYISFAFGSINIKNKSILPEEDARSFYRISFITMINNGLSQLMYLLDVFVLGIIDPQETLLASYSVATKIPAALSFIPLALITYLYPYFAEHRGDGKWCMQRYRQVLVYIGGFNALVSCFLFISAPLIIRIVFGAQYLDAVPIFRLLSLNYFISGTFRIISGNLLVTQRKLKFNLFVAIISSSLNVIANVLFIKRWGAIGAAYATVLVVIVSSVLSTSYLVYVFKNNTISKDGIS